MSNEISFEDMGKLLDASDHWYLLSHVKPDGDTLGAGSAFYAAGTERGKCVSWSGPSHVPPSYRFLPFIEKYTKSGWIDLDSFRGSEPLFVCVDISTLERAAGGLHALWRIVNIDHHVDNMKYGTHHHIEPGVSSTCELVWNFMKSQNWNISKDIAVGLYAGIMTDTGNFSFSNTKINTHNAAADLIRAGADPNSISIAVSGNRTIEGMHLWGVAMSRMRRVGARRHIGFSYLTIDDFRTTGADYGETEFFINQILLINGVEVAALMVEDVMQVRVSLRSVRGSVSVGKIARELGGGGHELAAGVVFEKSISEVIPFVLDTIEEEYAERDSAAEQA